jgi:hypothetical protein
MAASMPGWRKAMLLLVLPLLAGQPLVGIGNAREASLRTHDDASMLAQVSQAVLADEPYEEQARAVPGLMAPVWQEETPPVDQKLIEAQLNAVKAEQRELEALCSYARKAHADDACFLEQVKESCDRKASRLQSQYEALRAIRGDRRKQTTKFFASINRTRREIWRGLGPVGRRIVRNLTNDVMSVVQTQGKISGEVFRVLLRRHVRHELRTAALERVARKLGGAGGPGSDCDQKAAVAEPPPEESRESNNRPLADNTTFECAGLQGFREVSFMPGWRVSHAEETYWLTLWPSQGRFSAEYAFEGSRESLPGQSEIPFRLDLTYTGSGEGSLFEDLWMSAVLDVGQDGVITDVRGAESSHLDWQHHIVAMVTPDLQRAYVCDFLVTPPNVEDWREIVTESTFEAYCGQYYSYACNRVGGN